jgi:hypothetical protein
MPALPLDEAGKYVAAAYLVFLSLILVYVAIMAAKLARIDRELGDLADLAEGKRVGTRDEVPHSASPNDRSPSAPSAAEPAAPLVPEPGDTGGGAEDVGGVVRS